MFRMRNQNYQTPHHTLMFLYYSVSTFMINFRIKLPSKVRLFLLVKKIPKKSPLFFIDPFN